MWDRLSVDLELLLQQSIPGIQHSIGLVSVSYTHLDVYKRQAVRNLGFASNDEAIGELVTVECTDAPMQIIGVVKDYQDVYKRQHQG